MQASVGDRVSIEGKKVGQARRSGVVAKVSQGLSGIRYEIRWDDDTVSVIAPSAGMLCVEAKPAPKTKGAKAAKKAAKK